MCHELKNLVLLLLYAGLLGGCASALHANNMAATIFATKDAQITFDALGCPTAVVPPTIDVSKLAGDKVNWQAVDALGANIDDADFVIYFDPFKGKSLDSKGKGSVTSPKIDSDTPTGVEFKYTIVGIGCPSSPLDPRIKIL